MTASSASSRRCWASPSWPTIRASRPTRTALAHKPELEAELRALTKDRDGEAFANELMQNGVPSGAVMEVPDVMEHPHTKHRNMVWEKDGYRNVGNPVKLSRTPPSPAQQAQDLRRRHRAVLAEAGYSAAEIDKLSPGRRAHRDQEGEETRCSNPTC